MMSADNLQTYLARGKQILVISNLDEGSPFGVPKTRFFATRAHAWQVSSGAVAFRILLMPMYGSCSRSVSESRSQRN